MKCREPSELCESVRNPAATPWDVVALPSVGRHLLSGERGDVFWSPEKTCRCAYLFPVPCEFLAAVASRLGATPSRAQRTEAKPHRFAGETNQEITMLVRKDGPR